MPRILPKELGALRAKAISNQDDCGPSEAVRRALGRGVIPSFQGSVGTTEARQLDSDVVHNTPAPEGVERFSNAGTFETYLVEIHLEARIERGLGSEPTTSSKCPCPELLDTLVVEVRRATAPQRSPLEVSGARLHDVTLCSSDPGLGFGLWGDAGQ